MQFTPVGYMIFFFSSRVHRRTNQKLWFKQLGNSKRKLLPKQYIQQFAYKQITCVEYETLSADQEREIFQVGGKHLIVTTVIMIAMQRVQLGVALTPAGACAGSYNHIWLTRAIGTERMQAITGPWPTLIREIQQEMLGESGFDGQLDWGHARGRDFQCLTSIVYLVDKPKAAVPGAPQLEKWLQENDPVPAKFRLEVFDTFRIFGKLVRKFRNTFHKPTKVAPVEFVMIGVLIHTWRLKLSPTQLSSAIEKMRADVRTKYIDIRQNTKVSKTMLEFLKKKVKPSELKSDNQGDKPASSKASHTQSSTASKRKRAAFSSDESSDSESLKPPPPKSSTSKAVAGSSKAPVASSSCKPHNMFPWQLQITEAQFSGPATASKVPTRPKTPARQASVAKPALKSTMSSSKPPTVKTPVSTPRIPKVSDGTSRTTSPQIMAPPSTQQKPSVPPPGPPSAPPSQPPIKREPSMPPTPASADRPGAVHAVSSTPIQSPVIPGGSQTVHDPRRPQPQIQTNFDATSQQLQQSSWAQSPVPGTPSFPPGTPLDQSQLQVLLARAGLASQQNPTPTGPSSQYSQQNGTSISVHQPTNGAAGGPMPSATPPVTPHVPAFVQNPNNPLHSQSSSGNLQSGYGSTAPLAQGSTPATPNLGLPPKAPQAMRINTQTTANGTGIITPSQPSHSLPPRPDSAISASLPSKGSSGWYEGSDPYSRPRDRPRDARDYDSSSRGRGYDRDRDYGRHRDMGRSRSRERDSGWGSRGSGRSRTPRSPMRYGSK